MGMIQNMNTNAVRMLAECTVVGRAPSCDVRLKSAATSGEHAAIRWTDAHWRLIDLGSRNGTWVDGKRLANGASVDLERGTSIGFGSAAEAWFLADDCGPQAFVRSGGREIIMTHGPIALPSEAAPELEFVQANDGAWYVEDHDGTQPAVDRNIYVVGQDTWRLYLPSTLPRTAVVSSDATMADAALTIRHDATEEHIAASLLPATGPEVDLGQRAHHVVLLELVRARLEDRRSGHAMADEGWIHREDLSRRLRVDENHVNIYIHRLRKQVAESQVIDANGLVERRPRSGLMRIGPRTLTIGPAV